MFRGRRAHTGPAQLRNSLPRVRILGPTVWSVAACSTIYIGCAAYEVHNDAQRARRKGSRWTNESNTEILNELEELRRRDWRNSLATSYPEQQEFDDRGQLTRNLIAVNAIIHLVRYAPIHHSIASGFIHVPFLPRNYTLLTSVFAHSGFLHLAVNMYAMASFMPGAASSPIFSGSDAHLAAFYTSAGILSSLAAHITSTWKGQGFSGSLGASGALFALFGIFGVSFPNSQVGILFIPGQFPIDSAMACAAAFDAIGLFVRYPFIRLGHAAHLSGLALGVAYVKYGGDERIWRPGRRVALRAMRSLGVL
ncbi:hypothetical protein NUW58_g2087 [Xylaria curta]|uniref:Uncharacterized protein n=1 Tax=Xylaria curta TaxID=42375 RepID=A0ACC1PJ08_9PEZI|nr:hypothetical protein NUW58_g2087 [Xylaria curta]